MRYLLWRARHWHWNSSAIIVRRGRTPFCGKCETPFKIK